MNEPRHPSLVERLSDRRRLLEVGIGARTEVAAGLAAAGHDVRATDVVDVDVPAGVRFRREDVTRVETPDSFHEVDVVYALRCPPELHRPVRDLATALGVPFVFTTLGHDQPAVPVTRETLVDADGRPFTLFVADATRPGAGGRNAREREN